MPHLHGAGQDEGGENHRLRHGCDLGCHHHAVATPAIGEGARERSDNERGELVGEGDEPEHESRARHLVNEPAHGHPLHPGADQRDPLPGEEQAKVAVAKSPQGDA